MHEGQIKRSIDLVNHTSRQVTAATGWGESEFGSGEARSNVTRFEFMFWWFCSSPCLVVRGSCCRLHRGMSPIGRERRKQRTQTVETGQKEKEKRYTSKIRKGYCNTERRGTINWKTKGDGDNACSKPSVKI
jgi:hypothetical protein